MEKFNDNLATELNNEGICYLRIEMFDEAVNSFSRGLNLLKQTISQMADNDHSSDEFESESESISCSFVKLDLAQPTKRMSKEVKDHINRQSKSVFTNPMYIHTKINAVLNFRSFVSKSFVLIYNLALSHHMNARSDLSPSAKSKYIKAAALYEIAFSIQENEGIRLSFLQTMAIFNNLGQVNTALCDESKANYFFQNLLSTLIYLNISPNTQGPLEEIDEFLGNVMPLVLTNIAPAPAA